VRIWERFAAFCIDYLIVFVISLTFSILPALLIESMTTGSFQWSFYRDFLRPTDWLFVPAFLMIVAILFAYFYIHPVIGWGTIGQRIFGYRLEAVAGSAKHPFGYNIFLAFVGLCAWPISLYLAAKREDKAFWWNLRTGIRAVRVE